MKMRSFDNLTQDRTIPMTEQAISRLRRRMIEDMSIRKFAEKTQHDYVERVKHFATFSVALRTEPSRRTYGAFDCI